MYHIERIKKATALDSEGGNIYCPMVQKLSSCVWIHQTFNLHK